MKKITREKYIYSPTLIYIFKNPRISGPEQFKSVLFKSQLYLVFSLQENMRL